MQPCCRSRGSPDGGVSTEGLVPERADDARAARDDDAAYLVDRQAAPSSFGIHLPSRRAYLERRSSCRPSGVGRGTSVKGTEECGHAASAQTVDDGAACCADARNGAHVLVDERRYGWLVQVLAEGH